MSFYQPLQNSNSWLVYARSVAHLLLCVEVSNGHFLGAMGWDVFFPREPLASNHWHWIFDGFATL